LEKQLVCSDSVEKAILAQAEQREIISRICSPYTAAELQDIIEMEGLD